MSPIPLGKENEPYSQFFFHGREYKLKINIFFSVGEHACRQD
jgi:hypothetical protein